MGKPYIGRLIEFKRPSIEKDILRGFVLDYTEDLTLIARMDPDYWGIFGYSILRNDDIPAYRVPRHPSDYAYRALRVMNCRIPKTPSIDLTSWRTALSDAGRMFPLLNLHREKMDNTVCYIGRFLEATDKIVKLHEINPDATWDKISRFRLADVTLVGFNSPYEIALWRVAEENRRKKESRASNRKSPE